MIANFELGSKLSFRIGLVGAGHMASEYAKLVLAQSNFELTGIVSRTQTSALNFAKNVGHLRVYNTLEEMYRERTPDLVIVAVSELETRGVLREVWKFPWTCLVEKPAGYNIEEALEIAQGSRQARGETFLALNRRYYESTLAAKSILSDNAGPRYIQLTDQHDTEDAKASGKPPLILNNWHFANAIHTVDLAYFIARGKIDSVKGSVWQPTKKSFVLDSEIDFSSGDLVRYTSYWNVPQRWSLSISSPVIRVILSPLETLSSQIMGKLEITPIQLSGRDLTFKPGLSGLFGELTKKLEGKPHSLVSLEEGLSSMQLVERIFEPVRHLLSQNHLD